MHNGICKVSGIYGPVQRHHVFFKSQAKALVYCKLNLVNLNIDYHTGKYGVHNGNHELDVQLKQEVQENIRQAIIGLTTPKEIAEALDIKETVVRRSCKQLVGYKDTEEVLRALVGGRLY